MFNITEAPVRGTYRLNRDHNLARGLAAFWPLNDRSSIQAEDISGNNNHGAFTPVAVAGSSPPASPTGINFGSATDVMKCGNNASVRIGTAVTICAWVNAVSWTVTANTFNGVLEKLGGTSPFYNYGLRNAAGVMQFTIGTGTTQITLAFTTFPPTRVWCHLCGSYDGQNMRAFLNGIPVGSATQTGAMFDPVASVTMGDNSAFTGRSMLGRMACAMIYRRALAQNEIVELVARPYTMLLPLNSKKKAI